MNILGDVAKELLTMFLADVRLTISILLLVAIAGIFVDWLYFNPLVGGALLVVGTVLILVEAVARETKRSDP
jgi:hypothetical protein